MPNPHSPTTRVLGRWISCSNPRNLPQSAGIYRMRRTRNRVTQTMYIGKASNLRQRLSNHNRLRGGDKIQYKLVPHPRRMYKDPVRRANRSRLDIAERLHFRSELARGQNCRRNSDLRRWVRSYNNLPRSRQQIQLTRRT